MGIFAVKERVPEADAYDGAILDGPGLDMEVYSEYMRKHLASEYRRLIDFLIDELKIKPDGRVLEVGPGPGWIGIWLAQRVPTLEVVGLELSPDMIRVAEKNRDEEGVTNATFVQGDAANMRQFEDTSFDAVFSNGSLHHWMDPVAVFDEIARVLKPDGVYAICDGRRDIGVLGWLIYYVATTLFRLRDRSSSDEMRRGWKTSIEAGYTPAEIREILAQTRLPDWDLQTHFMELTVRPA